MRVERSQRLWVLPKYFRTQGRMGIGGTHWDMASTKQFRALGWQSLWAWWLPLQRKGLISPDKAWRGEKARSSTTQYYFSSSALIRHIDKGIELHVRDATWCHFPVRECCSETGKKRQTITHRRNGNCMLLFCITPHHDQQVSQDQSVNHVALLHTYLRYFLQYCKNMVTALVLQHLTTLSSSF